jgi:hypothetical protein
MGSKDYFAALRAQGGGILMDPPRRKPAMTSFERLKKRLPRIF